MMEIEKTMLNRRQIIMRMRELAVNPFAPDSEINPWRRFLPGIPVDFLKFRTPKSESHSSDSQNIPDNTA
jgi:hypothetical protein